MLVIAVRHVFRSSAGMRGLIGGGNRFPLSCDGMVVLAPGGGFGGWRLMHMGTECV